MVGRVYGILVQVRYSEGGRGLGGLGLDLVKPVLAVEVVMCWFLVLPCFRSFPLRGFPFPSPVDLWVNWVPVPLAVGW